LLTRPSASPATVTIEHPSGTIDVVVDYDITDNGLDLKSAGLVRTARKLASGQLFISN
jgi:2-methylaconitate cis-trans-isomerase PrpF